MASKPARQSLISGRLMRPVTDNPVVGRDGSALRLRALAELALSRSVLGQAMKTIFTRICDTKLTMSCDFTEDATRTRLVVSIPSSGSFLDIFHSAWEFMPLRLFRRFRVIACEVLEACARVVETELDSAMQQKRDSFR